MIIKTDDSNWCYLMPQSKDKSNIELIDEILNMM